MSLRDAAPGLVVMLWVEVGAGGEASYGLAATCRAERRRMALGSFCILGRAQGLLPGPLESPTLAAPPVAKLGSEGLRGLLNQGLTEPRGGEALLLDASRYLSTARPDSHPPW